MISWKQSLILLMLGKSKVKLSIIIPTKDGSIRAKIPQREDVEVVVVNGVSPVGKARNEGLKRAQGEHIAWIDSDDEVSEDYIDEILASLEFGVQGIGLDVVWLNYRIGEGVFPPKGDVIFQVLMGRKRMMSLWSFASNRSLWEGIEFDERASVMEDWDVMLKLMSKATSFGKIMQPIYRYVVNPKSTTHQDHREEVKARLEAWEREFRKSPLHRKLRYRLAAFIGVKRMKKWFRI